MGKPLQDRIEALYKNERVDIEEARKDWLYRLLLILLKIMSIRTGIKLNSIRSYLLSAFYQVVQWVNE